MYPLFYAHFRYNSSRNECARASESFLSTDTYGASLQNQASRIRRNQSLHLKGFARQLTAIWSARLFAERCHDALVHYHSSQPADSTHFLTHAEVELTKKAMIAGMTHREIMALPVEHLASADAALSGRWKALLAAVLQHAREQIKEHGKSAVLIHYWLLYALPNGADNADLRFRHYQLLTERGVSLLSLRKDRYAAITPHERDCSICVPNFAYAGHSVRHQEGGGTQIAVHVPDCATHFPKRTFVFSLGRTSAENLYAHPGRQCLLINDRPDMEKPITLTSGNFPLVLPGPTILDRSFRVGNLLQQLTNHSLGPTLDEVSAFLAIRTLESINYGAFDVGRKCPLGAQPEVFTGLVMDRAPTIELNGSESDNTETAIELLKTIDRHLNANYDND